MRTDRGLKASTCRFDYYLLSDEDLGKDCTRDCEEDFRECVILCGGISSCISNCNRDDVTCKDSKLYTQGSFDQQTHFDNLKAVRVVLNVQPVAWTTVPVDIASGHFWC